MTSMSAKLVEIYLQWQCALSRWGCTPVADDLFFKLAREIECNPFLDVRGFTAVLDQLHTQAFPDPRTRPPRLYAHELQDIRE